MLTVLKHPPPLGTYLLFFAEFVVSTLFDLDHSVATGQAVSDDKTKPPRNCTFCQQAKNNIVNA